MVVTGAARGVGRAIAQECARQGARLVLCDVLEELGRETAAAIGAAGAQVRFASVDLADPESIQAFAASVGQQEGSIHGLVNNAAIATRVGGAAVRGHRAGPVGPRHERECARHLAHDARDEPAVRAAVTGAS